MSIIEKAVDRLNGADDTGANAGSATGQCSSELAEESSARGGKDVNARRTAQTRPADPDIRLPLAHLREKGMVTHDRPRSPMAESYRMIKRPLLTNIAGKGAVEVPNSNLIMVTSSLQGEGKTFTAVNLAMSIAMEENKTVLLVDADFAKASASALLGIPKGSPGLIDVLEKPDVSVADTLIHTDVPNLRVIPAGHIHSRCTEMLASEGMAQLLVELSNRYPDRIIIFDSPPLLVTTEAPVLARLVGQIVFVVAAEQTPRAVVQQALEHIGNDKVIGTVLNKTRTYFWDRFRYGGGYVYGYSYGYHYANAENTNKTG